MLPSIDGETILEATKLAIRADIVAQGGPAGGDALRQHRLDLGHQPCRARFASSTALRISSELRVAEMRISSMISRECSW